MGEKLFLQVRDMIAEHLRLDAESITLQSSIREDLKADSLDLVEMIMGMEEMFDIEISETEAEAILTIGDAVSFLERRLSL